MHINSSNIYSAWDCNDQNEIKVKGKEWDLSLFSHWYAKILDRHADIFKSTLSTSYYIYYQLFSANQFIEEFILMFRKKMGDRDELHVLAVDDSVIERKFLEIMLKKSHYKGNINHVLIYFSIYSFATNQKKKKMNSISAVIRIVVLIPHYKGNIHVYI